ncbi:MAG: hypothetical protein ACLRWH_05400 [Emergencia sp.]
MSIFWILFSFFDLIKYLQISEETPEKLLGYFSLLSALIYSRAVCPCSKAKTFDVVLPKLYEPARFSLNQLYAGLEHLGSEYEKIFEIYNHQINRKYPFDTSHTYFDCTNIYFEIDREDAFRPKEPSKENRKDPIVGTGLLLDTHQIPIGMKLYPGTESEKPVIPKVIDDLKSWNNISEKKIQVADKGLNCPENILHAVKSGDGYLFSKSVKQFPETEQVWVLLENE